MPDPVDEEKTESPTKKPPVAEQIVVLIKSAYEVVLSTDGECLAVPLRGPKVVRSLKGGVGSLQKELAARYNHATGKVAGDKPIKDALAILEGEAAAAGPVEVHVRVADDGANHFLDLGDATGRAVLWSEDGWEVVDNPHVVFRRSALTAPLPVPSRIGDLNLLFEILNVPDHMRAIVKAFLVAALFEKIAHPILGVNGEQGSGKSKLTLYLTCLFDPSPAPFRKPPTKAEEWITSLKGGWCVSIDNVSRILDWFSDAMCRVSTGEGDVRRRLFTDDDLVVFTYRRVLIINGINLSDVREDVNDRLITLTLPTIPPYQRRTESELDAEWERHRPAILGGLLDLACEVAKRLPSVTLAEMPRLADFARIQKAVDEIDGSDGLGTYLGLAESRAATALDNDPWLSRLSDVLDEQWEGTAKDLLARTSPEGFGGAPAGWPRTPRMVGDALTARAPILRAAGWAVEPLGNANKDKVLRWRIVPPETNEAGQAGQAGQEFPSSSLNLEEVGSGRGRDVVPDLYPASPADPSTCRHCGAEAGELLYSRFGRPVQCGKCSNYFWAELVAMALDGATEVAGT